MNLREFRCYCGSRADLICRRCRLRSGDLCHCRPTPDAPAGIPLDATPTAADCGHAHKVIQHYQHGHLALRCLDCDREWRIASEGEDACRHPTGLVRRRPDGRGDLICTHCGDRKSFDSNESFLGEVWRHPMESPS